MDVITNKIGLLELIRSKLNRLINQTEIKDTHKNILTH
jgi:hypothetical protein